VRGLASAKSTLALIPVDCCHFLQWRAPARVARYDADEDPEKKLPGKFLPRKNLFEKTFPSDHLGHQRPTGRVEEGSE
jgi:hypothetical protein